MDKKTRQKSSHWWPTRRHIFVKNELSKNPYEFLHNFGRDKNSRVVMKNDPLMRHKLRTTWPPLTLMFLASSSSFYTEHVYCFLKKPWRWINSKVELSRYFWKQWSRAVVRLTYLHHFKSDCQFQIWFILSYKFLIDLSAMYISKTVRWRRKELRTCSEQGIEEHLFWAGP